MKFKDRINTFVTKETRSLSIATLVVSPQGSAFRDITTLCEVKFYFSQYGSVMAVPDFKSVSQSFPSWFVMVAIYLTLACIALGHAVKHFIYMRTGHGAVDIIFYLLSSASLVYNLYIELSPPDMIKELTDAFVANEQAHYFTAYAHISEKAHHVKLVLKIGFVVCLFLVFRTMTLLNIHPRCELILVALRRCSADVFQVGFALSPMLLVLAFLGFASFGPKADILGFSSYLEALQLTVTYLVPSIPSQWGSTSHSLYIIWAITCIFVMRLFYLITIAVIVKSFMDAKNLQDGIKAHKTLPEDLLDMVKGWRIAFEMPPRSLLLNQVESNKSSSTASSVVTADDLAQVMSNHFGDDYHSKSAQLLNYYSRKLSTDGEKVHLENHSMSQNGHIGVAAEAEHDNTKIAAQLRALTDSQNQAAADVEEILKCVMTTTPTTTIITRL